MRKAEVAITAVRDSLATQSAPAQRAKRNERKRQMIPEYHLRKMIEVGTVGAEFGRCGQCFESLSANPNRERQGTMQAFSWFGSHRQS